MAVTEYPPLGQEVVVTFTGNVDQALAYWDGSQWMVGVDNDPNDAPLGHAVESWIWRAD